MISPEILGTALLIFVLRIANNALGTLRVVIITRQQRWLAAVMGFFEALMFAITVAVVVADLSNVIILFSYCFGFAVGSYVGMVLETRLITSYMIANVIATQGHEIAIALREAGFGVTETLGEGRNGQVVMLRSVITHREVPRLLEVIRETQPDAFVAVEEARAVHRGWMRAARIQQ